MSRPNEPKLPRDEYTEYIYDKTYFGETVNVQTFKNVISGINSDMEVENCPRTVQEWCKGTTPDVTNRQNNYELCYALEMD